MERAKKMVLIPMESMERFQRRVTDGVAAAVSSADTSDSGRGGADPLTRLDKEMSDILKLQTTDNAEKWKLYQQVLQRYLYFSKEARKPIQLDIREEGGDTGTDVDGAPLKQEIGGETSGEERLNLGRVLGTIPKKFIAKAKLLLGMLTDMPTRFSWNNVGAVAIDGVPVPGANIIDLTNLATRSRKSFDPVGRFQFARFLHAVNVPRDYVGNETFWRDIRLFDNEKVANAASSAVAVASSSSSARRAIDGSHGTLASARRFSRGGDDSYRSDSIGSNEIAEEEESGNIIETPVTSKRKSRRDVPHGQSSGKKERKSGWMELRLKK